MTFADFRVLDVGGDGRHGVSRPVRGTRPRGLPKARAQHLHCPGFIALQPGQRATLRTTQLFTEPTSLRAEKAGGVTELRQRFNRLDVAVESSRGFKAVQRTAWREPLEDPAGHRASMETAWFSSADDRSHSRPS